MSGEIPPHRSAAASDGYVEVGNPFVHCPSFDGTVSGRERLGAPEGVSARRLPKLAALDQRLDARRIETTQACAVADARRPSYRPRGMYALT